MRLNQVEKRTFFLLMLASFFNGFVFSSFQIQDIIAKKALHALDWQITLLVMLWPISNLFSIWWGKILEHSGNLSGFFVLSGFVGRLCLLLMLWINNFYHYLIILVIVFSFNSFLSPAQNSIYQINIKQENRGIIFGYTSSLITLVMILASYIAGRILDINESWFRYIFAFVGIMGCISALIMALIKVRKNGSREKAFTNLKQLFIKPIARMLEVLKQDRDYAVFQRNFFIYGMAFMMILPAIPKYLIDYLNMDYSQTFLAKAIISQVGILILAPIAGKVFDNKNPAFFTSLTFGCVSLYPLILLISSFFIGHPFANYFVYLAFLVFGIGMSGMIIAWNISSIYFAGDQDVSMYQSVHVTLTGIRGLFAPFLGLAVMKLFGIRTLFVITILLLLLASVLSYKLYLAMDKKKFKLNLHGRKFMIYLRKIFPFG